MLCLLNEKWHATEEYLPKRGELSVIGKLFRGTRIVAPKQLRCQLLKLVHEGHPKIVATKQHLRTKVWWPGTDKEMNRAVCKTCHGWQLVSQPSKPELITRTELPFAPWQLLVFVIVDYYSRFLILWDVVYENLRRMYQYCPGFSSLTGSLCPQGPTMDRSLSVIISTRTWRKTTNHNLMATGKWRDRKTKPKYCPSRGSQLEIRWTIFQWCVVLHHILLLGLVPQKCRLQRRIRTKLFHFEEFSIEDEVRDHDSDRKETGKINADCQRNACESEIQEGDKVL